MSQKGSEREEVKKEKGEQEQTAIKTVGGEGQGWGGVGVCRRDGVGGRTNVPSVAAALTLHLWLLVAPLKLKYFPACVRSVHNGNYDRSDQAGESGPGERLWAAGATLCIPACVNKINYKRGGARRVTSAHAGESHGGHPNGIFSRSLIIQLVLT